MAGNATKFCSVLVRVCIFQQHCCCILHEHNFSLVCTHIYSCTFLLIFCPCYCSHLKWLIVQKFWRKFFDLWDFFLHGLLYSILVTVQSKLAKKNRVILYTLLCHSCFFSPVFLHIAFIQWRETQNFVRILHGSESLTRDVQKSLQLEIFLLKNLDPAPEQDFSSALLKWGQWSCSLTGHGCTEQWHEVTLRAPPAQHPTHMMD